MNWIKITQYLPGDSRMIQIWNDPQWDDRDNPLGNNYGFYSIETKKWWSVKDGQTELKNVTHWAEMLSKPDEL